jgi:hypothetical protein
MQPFNKYAQLTPSLSTTTTAATTPFPQQLSVQYNGTPFFGAKGGPVPDPVRPNMEHARGQGRIQLRAGEHYSAHPLNTTSPSPSSSSSSSSSQSNASGDTARVVVSRSRGGDSIACISAMQQPTALSRAYFSPANVTIIQNALRKGVFDQTATMVCEQDPEQLQLVMRSVFLTYSRNDTSSADVIRNQISEMNSKVLEYCVGVVASNLKQQKQYLVDITTGPSYMDHAVSTTENKTLEFKPFV